MDQKKNTEKEEPYRKVILEEKAQLRLRRKKLNIEPENPKEENWFGIALSGGGIRSATINLGFLKTMNRFGILKKADYLSSVSGGGYTHSYVQGTVKATGGVEHLFSDEHIAAMREHGEYLTPGKGLWKLANTLLLLVAVGISWCMSIVSPLIAGGIVYYAYGIIAGLIGVNPIAGTESMAGDIALWTLYGAVGIFVLHFVTNIYLNFHLGVSKMFNKLETVLAAVIIAVYLWVVLAGVDGNASSSEGLLGPLVKLATLFVLGFYVNPNALSLHRFYRKQLSELYLHFAGPFKNIPLKDLFDANSDDPKQYTAPYPIINTCLNLLSPGGGEKFKGVKANDYFLLSPLYCGSKLTDYRPTTFYDDFRNMTLPAAITISAAAVNPGMGMYSNKMLSVLMTLFNARFGCWVPNPSVMKKAYALVWWPLYFFKELLGRISMRNKMVNISDGGHIENFGAYELLRRGCKLIIAVDASEDRNYAFTDLNNFILRARNELGLEIRFRDDQQPEDIIRPKPSQVFSKQRFAVADIYQWWEDNKIVLDENQPVLEKIDNFDEPKKVGTFVYVKSSVTAPSGKPDLDEDDKLRYGTYKYKIYHPEFPHESTGDQFFDPIQWESYYQLGQYLGADILGLNSLEESDIADLPEPTVQKLIDWFDYAAACPLFATEMSPEHEAGYESMKRGAAPAPEYRM